MVRGMMLLIAPLIAARSVPEWYESYHMALTFKIPYVNVVIPVSVINERDNASSGKKARQKVEYFQGLQQEIVSEALGRAKYVFRNGKRICMRNEEPHMREDGSLVVVDFLPDLSTYKYAGKELLAGVWADKYVFNQPHYPSANGVTSVFDRIQFYYDPVVEKPLKWVMLARNQIISSHTDTWIVTYHEYKKATYPIVVPEECLDARAVRADFALLSHGLFQHIHSASKLQAFKNMGTIQELNAKHADSTTFAANRFLDMEYDDVLKYRTGLKKLTGLKAVRRTPTYIIPREARPKSFDWRDVDEVIPKVKDQGFCGSCWAFSMISAIESAHALLTGQLTLLPEQAIVDCTWSDNNAACDGGLQSDGAAHVLEHYEGFIPSAASYGTYISVDGKCDEEKMKDRTSGAKLREWRTVPPRDDEQLIQALLKQPVAISIAVPQEMIWYESGVLDVPSCKVSSTNDLDHAVNLVGFGTAEGGKDYWLVRNSWSTNWGDDGYLKVVRGENDCGISLLGEYPIVEALEHDINLVA
eukprot:GEMP01037592.1.p1 GENE.GEMP01037592.1~~GEMP01037592.1.p1  ORF type:complete len:529 (+),score=142.99 GEMP01037592.1:332-1918(+)